MKRLINIIFAFFVLVFITGCYMPGLKKLNLLVGNHGKYNSYYNLISMECTDNEKAKIYYSYGEDFSLNNCFLYEPSLYYLNNKYIQGILVSSDRSISAVATCRGYVDSDILTISTKALVSKPSISDKGIYKYDSSKRIISINCSDSNATIKYTTNGSSPTDYSSSYTPYNYYTVEGYSYYGILVDAGSTIKAISVKNGNKSEVVTMDAVSKPVIIDRGIYAYNSSKKIVSIICSTNDANIKYTIGGSNPNSYYYPSNYYSSSGNYYSGILVPVGSTISVIATKEGCLSSKITSLSVY